MSLCRSVAPPCLMTFRRRSTTHCTRRRHWTPCSSKQTLDSPGVDSSGHPAPKTDIGLSRSGQQWAPCSSKQTLDSPGVDSSGHPAPQNRHWTLQEWTAVGTLLLKTDIGLSRSGQQWAPCSSKQTLDSPGVDSSGHPAPKNRHWTLQEWTAVGTLLLKTDIGLSRSGQQWAPCS